MNPKVFISHASEDKDRFVTLFASKLRERGVDAWLDAWEMQPGDSLVNKIFEEGLKNAQAVVIVLSNFSVAKPWVRDELDASVVSRISKGTRIIPVVLDDCEVPEALKHLLWVSILNTNEYSSEFSKIINTIFGVTDKPELGSTPDHDKGMYAEIGGLSKSDNLILKASCDHFLREPHALIDPAEYFGEENSFGLSAQEISDCVEILEQNGCLDVTSSLESCNYRVSTHGFEQYARAYVDNYQEIVISAVALIVNEGVTTNNEISEKTNTPVRVANHILDVLETNGHIRVSQLMSGTKEIYHVAASLRRAIT